MATKVRRAELIAAVRERSLQRAAQWDAHADRLRGLVPKALDTLAEALESAEPRQRVAVALWVLRAAGFGALQPPMPEREEWLALRDDAELRRMLGEGGGEG